MRGLFGVVETCLDNLTGLDVIGVRKRVECRGVQIGFPNGVRFTLVPYVDFAWSDVGNTIVGVGDRGGKSSRLAGLAGCVCCDSGEEGAGEDTDETKVEEAGVGEEVKEEDILVGGGVEAGKELVVDEVEVVEDGREDEKGVEEQVEGAEVHVDGEVDVDKEDEDCEELDGE